jgi:hypothetical protein
MASILKSMTVYNQSFIKIAVQDHHTSLLEIIMYIVESMLLLIFFSTHMFIRKTSMLSFSTCQHELIVKATLIKLTLIVTMIWILQNHLAWPYIIVIYFRSWLKDMIFISLYEACLIWYFSGIMFGLAIWHNITSNMYTAKNFEIFRKFNWSSHAIIGIGFLQKIWFPPSILTRHYFLNIFNFLLLKLYD